MKNIKVSIIIVHWNTPHLLEECLRSLGHHERNLDYEVIVLDNASRAALSENIRGVMDGVRLVRLKENIGFGRACNLGANMAQGDILLFLGPDVRFTEDGAVARTLAQYLALPDAGAVSCLLLNPGGTPQKHYFNLPAPGRIIQEWWQEATNHLPWVHRRRQGRKLPLVQEVDMVIAHWLMVRRNRFWQAGGFPQDAFMFGDDIEINHRLRKIGCRNYLYRGARAVHHGSASTRGRYGQRLVNIVQDSITRFCIQNYGPVVGALSVFLIILRAFLNLLLLSPLYIGRGYGCYFRDQFAILWHYMVYQWRREKIRSLW